MKRIGLLSDTHGYIHTRLNYFFENCDELWHAGDIGNIETADTLASFKPFLAVYGNIDGPDLRQIYPKHLRFKCEETNVWITHIGGYPKHYDKSICQELKNNPPQLFICGHSHILKVIYDKELKLLHINPGAAGKYGFHQVSTAIRFIIDGKDIRELDILELSK